MHQATLRTEDVPYALQLSGLDPAGLTLALAESLVGAARRPQAVAKALAAFLRDESGVALDAARTALGATAEPSLAPEPGDARFRDRAWRENPLLRLTLGSYLAASNAARAVVDGAEVSEVTRRKARFLLDLGLDAASPSNVPWLNPAVAKEALETGGLSVIRGLANVLEDLADGGTSDRDAFQVGRDLAVTPGRVVFRNDLIELLAYEPQTETVFAEPIVYSPPWINKYYVLDLAPGRSFIEHAVRSGFTVFAISYRNPDASMAELTLDDYLRDGVMAGLDRAREITGSQRVNVLAVCLGGTLAAIALAALAARGRGDEVGWATFLNTLVDFEDPGEIAVFTDEPAVERLEQRMRSRGYLSAGELSGPFTLMRSNDLVWRYVISSWYQGKRPPPFDILAWNADATRMPASMHSQYLRACYVDNRLVEADAFVADGTPVDVSRIESPLYVLGGDADHIAPWRSTYRTTQLVGGEARFVLSSSGHIASMVNPPGNPKAGYATRDGCPADPDEWLAGAERVQGTWWDDWVRWASERSGARVLPPQLPAGAPAPGAYVHG